MGAASNSEYGRAAIAMRLPHPRPSTPAAPRCGVGARGMGYRYVEWLQGSSLAHRPCSTVLNSGTSVAAGAAKAIVGVAAPNVRTLDAGLPAVYNRTMGEIIINTGDGKGKTTAALGVVLRAAGYGQKILIVQFIKGSWHYGELDALALLPAVEIMRVGKGFVGILDDKLPFSEHQAAARQGLAEARVKISEGGYDLVVLDEINNAVYMDLVPLEDVLDLVAARPSKTSIVLTGRYAHPRLIALADLVTEMRDVKHPQRAFRKGIGF